MTSKFNSIKKGYLPESTSQKSTSLKLQSYLFTFRLLLLSYFLILSVFSGHLVYAQSTYHITGKLIDDVTGDGTFDLGEKGTNLGTSNINGLWINLVSSSDIVIESVPVNLDGSYSLPVNQSGIYSIIFTANNRTISTTLTTSDPLPGYWQFTGADHLNGIKKNITISQNVSNLYFFIKEFRPLIFGLFGLTNNTSSVDLEWNIHLQDNSVSGYEIQRSIDGNLWSAIATVPAKSKAPQAAYWTYNFTDSSPLTGTSHYRVKQVSDNSNSEISTSRQINRLAPPIPSCPCTVSGYVWDDKSGNGMTDLGENATNLGNTNENGLWMNLVNSLNQVVSSVPVKLDGSYSLTANQTGTYSVIVSANQKQIQTTLTSADPLPGHWRYTAISNTMLTPDLSNHTGIISNILVDKNIGGLFFFIKDFTPLIFNAFWLINNEQNVDLRWFIDLQENTLQYEIERSTDNMNWIAIDYVSPKTKGAGETLWTYSYLDLNPLQGIAYYRVKQRANDNSYTNSASVSVTRVPAPVIDCPCTISGYVWDDITGDNTHDLGERRLNLGTTNNNGIWINLTNSTNLVLSSVPVTLDGQYTMSVPQKGVYSLIITSSQKEIGTSLTESDPAPTGWVYYNAANPANIQNGNLRNSSGKIQNFTVADNLGFIWFSVQQTSLPVVLSKFNARILESQVLLNWKTTMEVNSHSFNIERSKDGKTWVQIGTLLTNAVSNETNQVTKYNFIDLSPLSGQSYYRLKLVDLDNSYSYSTIQTVEFSSNSILIYPNPARKVLQFRGLSDQGTVIIYDQSGRIIKTTRTFENQINIEEIPVGYYLISVEENINGGIKKTGNFIKQ